MAVERAPQAVKENVDNVVELERNALGARNLRDRVADRIAGFVGTLTFVLLHIVAVCVYVAWNTGHLDHPAFDPYPFSLLSVIIGTEAVLLSAFVLIKQNRMGLIADRRAHLDLQIGLLAEREITRVLQLTEQLAERAGIDFAGDSHAKGLTQKTDVMHVARTLHEKLEAEP